MSYIARLPEYPPSVGAFLDMLAFSEGTAKCPITKFDGYDVIVTGADGKPETFTDFSTHPFDNGRKSKVINSHGLTSNASGRYQFMLRDWHHYRDQLGLKDFGPLAQDLWAIQLLKEARAYNNIVIGYFEGAIQNSAHLWASLPGANYTGQNMRPMAALQQAYKAAGGVVA